MNNLTTTHLKCLLEKATPGPWTVIETYPDGAPRPDMSRQIRSANGEYLGIMHGQNAHLAAHAPQLAGEVLWMRKQLASMRKAWLSVADDPKRMVAERTLANHAVQNIDYILGETNE